MKILKTPMLLFLMPVFGWMSIGIPVALSTAQFLSAAEPTVEAEVLSPAQWERVDVAVGRGLEQLTKIRAHGPLQLACQSLTVPARRDCESVPESIAEKGKLL